MANKTDNDARALLDALCEWIVTDLNYMPIAATKLRERFEAATACGMLQREQRRSNGAPNHDGKCV